jgi:hypothetical protein
MKRVRLRGYKLPIVREPAVDGEILPPESDPPPQPPPNKVKPLTLDDLKRRPGESLDEFIRRLPPGMGPRWGEGTGGIWHRRLAKARRDLRSAKLTPQQRQEARQQQQEERKAASEAADMVTRAWRKAFPISVPFGTRIAALGRALSEARANAREELRQKRRMEAEEKKAREVSLPDHITRIKKKRQ